MAEEIGLHLAGRVDWVTLEASQVRHGDAKANTFRELVEGRLRPETLGRLAKGPVLWSSVSFRS